MKTVLTYGTFDLFHIGHLNLLKRARALGDKLIVAVSTDEFNATKGKTTLMPFEHRVELVRSVRYVDEVIAEHQWEQKIADVQQHKVDVFVMGSDWQGKFDFLTPYCEVVYLPRTDNVSSTDLKKAIQVFMQLKRDFLD
jgi:glycerol-3-phosphate cytidylyltransferase